jgi:hypothetical protein
MEHKSLRRVRKSAWVETADGRQTENRKEKMENRLEPTGETENGFPRAWRAAQVQTTEAWECQGS